MPTQEYAALVVGAGIGGIRAALDLAETEHKVLLIDNKPHLGGLLAQLDYQFPSDHCGMCKMLPLTERDDSSQFCLRKGLFHRNLDILLSSRLTSLEGEPGKFQAVVKQQSSLVDAHKCISCGQCSTVCPVRIPDTFNAGLGERAAIYLPVPHNIPNQYVVDLAHCTRCWKCAEACPTGAVDFKFAERANFPILVAHQDSSLRQSIDQSLADENFPLHWATTGEEALRMVEQETSLGLVLLDSTFADVTAQRVLQRGLEIHPDLQVVAMAPESVAEAAQALVANGARTTLATPLTDDFPGWLDKLYLRITSETSHQLEVGAVILAGGFECYDPAPVHDVLGYKDHPQVVTSLEFERLLSSTGPCGGDLQRSDGKPVQSIAWLQCVGSRDRQKNADYCSSICCMFAIKEALLAKDHARDQIETTIFAMDVRTFGKGYQRYRDHAEQERGVRFVIARPHSIIPDGHGGLLLQYIDENGQPQNAEYDMVVLATGAKPPQDMPGLIQATGIECNEFGFCRTDALAPTRTSQFGVFAAGAFGEPKDIADTVIQASAAALEASRLIYLYAAPKRWEKEPEPTYRRVEQEAPRTLVVLCDACPTLEQSVDMPTLTEQLQQMSSVQEVVRIPQACTEAGWQRIEDQVRQSAPNRIVLGACLPYAHVPRLRQLGRTVALDPAFMEVVDIYTPTFPDMPLTSEQRLREIVSNLGMAVVKVQSASPTPLLKPVPVTPKALVVGAGLAGMTAAMAVADHGMDAYLVEEGDSLGGTANRLRSTLEGSDPVKYIQDLCEQVQKHPKITLLTESRITLSMGRAGQFLSAVQTEAGQSLTIEHGATILATGGKEAKSYAYGYGTRKTIFSQLQFEDKLATGAIDAGALSGVVMIQCVECREEPRNYCSRVCCATAVKNAITLKRRNPKLPVYILYRDMMTYGFSEHSYTEARRLGVVFIRYTPAHKPQVECMDDDRYRVTLTEPILQRPLEIHADLLVLATGIVPNEVEELSEIFRVPVDQDGFFQEAESKWRPVEFLRQGVFVCGLARAPGNMRETVASAKAAAQRALRLLTHDRIAGGTVTAEVRHSLCSLCQACVNVCPYGARSLDWENEQIVVDEILCQGCGACTAVCPNSAAVLRGFQDEQVLAEIDASLGVVP
ncbi:FAD-dependent oxidoreductase [Desulfohalobium retbaense]|uniref:Response regulator receiver protein n=1 Tax=Desulfohalobium retbaense (strain ATCC 49708 / DSM 5692 / JCM 16813 / HR100) TaxID=485915 RepID=C8X090_DESRD|nr:FAD-dependent oxidoreductase [Desulfohalobium retbaense]ACV67715.1 response regulator receiver protein [Desulfohalobium retbaense DSM 5692]